MKFILLCGGIGSRYNNYSLPKPLNYINGKHMIEYTISNIPSNEIYIIYNIFLDQYNFKEIVINKCKNKLFHFACVDYLTRGAVESAYIGIQQFDKLQNDQDNILFIDNDNLHHFENIHTCHFDSHFIGYSVDETNKSNYSFIQIDNDYVSNIEEKNKISNFFCCGLYGFSNTASFMKHASSMLQKNHKTNNEFYFSQLYKLLLSLSFESKENNIVPVFIDKTQHIGSFKEITTFTFDIPKPTLRICFDLDNTLVSYPSVVYDYTTVKPIHKNIQLLRMFKNQGHEIIIHTARRMATHNANVGKVIKDIALITINTLEEFNIPYDELIFGKPYADIYIDDRSLNPYINKISQFGFFTNDDDFLPNKIEPNKYNTIQMIDNKIIKKGPLQFVQGELFFYQNVPPHLQYLFPSLLHFNSNDDKTNIITIELEYIKGIPLFYLYKHKMITPEIIDSLFSLLNILHYDNKLVIDKTITTSHIKNNYTEKIKKRFEKKEHYPFDDAETVFNEIIEGLTKTFSPVIVSLIHGDFWFSNIIMLYDDSFKFIDMKGQVDGILTLTGDCYYDYGKLYQSILGYDLVLNDIIPDNEYVEKTKEIFFDKCKEKGVQMDYLKFVTKSLIFGTFHSIYKSNQTKQNIWNLLKSI